MWSQCYPLEGPHFLDKTTDEARHLISSENPSSRRSINESDPVMKLFVKNLLIRFLMIVLMIGVLIVWIGVTEILHLEWWVNPCGWLIVVISFIVMDGFLTKQSIWKRLAYTIATTAALVTFVFVVLTLQNLLGKRALNQWLSEKRSQGEKFTLAELNIPKAPLENNGATNFTEAALKLKAVDEKLNKELPRKSNSGTSRSLAGKRLIRTALPRFYLPMNSNAKAITWEEVKKILDENRESIDLARKAIHEPIIQVDIDYSKGFAMLTPHLSQGRSITRYLSTSAHYNLHEKNYDAAIDDIEDMMKLSEYDPYEWNLIACLVKIAIKAIASGATWEAIQSEGLNESQLARLQSIWQLHPNTNLKQALLGERAVCIQEMEKIKRRSFSESLKLTSMLDLAAEVNSEDGFYKPLEYLFLAAWKTGWINEDELATIQSYEPLFKMLDQIGGPKTWSQINTEYEIEFERTNANRNWYKKYRFVMARVLSPALERSILSECRSELDCQINVAVLALKRYSLKNNGQYPKSLSELVPIYLEKLPWDPLGARPLSYHLNDDGSFTLYSVGENGVDDGGDPTANPNKASTTLEWQGKDIVWPKPATLEEAAEYDSAYAK